MTVNAAESTDAGQIAYDAGDYAEAGRLWQSLAEQGDARAMLRLGSLYDLGRGVPRDETVAFRDYSMAARAGLPEAEFNVAVMYDSGVGVANSVDLAALWYARAASRGYPRAEYNLGQLCASGDGMPRNVAVAKAWFRVAADAGLQAAAERLATLRASDAPPAGDSHTILSPVVPASPRNGDTIAIHGDTADAELIWLAPEQSTSVRFYVQVMRNVNGVAQERFGAFTETSAMLVKLPPEPADYAWRVYTVGTGVTNYAPSGWYRFKVASSPDVMHAAVQPP